VGEGQRVFENRVLRTIFETKMKDVTKGLENSSIIN
jgi:hypothetical protein